MQARKRIVSPISSAKRLLPFLPLITALVLSLSGCAASATATMLPTSLTTSESKVHSMPAIYGFTHQNPDGNRYLKGQAGLSNVQTLNIKLAGTPRWLVAAPLGSGSVWVLVLEDGPTQAFLVEAGQATETTIAPARIPSGGPPLLIVSGDQASLVSGPSNSASEITHPVPLGDSGKLAFIEIAGDLVL